MLKRILVPLDGSEFAEHALPFAKSLALNTGAELRLFQILAPLHDRFFWTPMPGSELEGDLHRRSWQEARDYLDSLADRLRKLGVSKITCDVSEQKAEVADSLRDEAAYAAADLVVMASHGREALSRFWRNSVADEFIRSTSMPVLMVRPRDCKADFEIDVAGGGHILVALDGTAMAEEMLNPALDLGEAINARFTLVRVTPTAHRGGAGGRATGVEGPDDPAAYLNLMARIFAARGAKVETRVVTSDDPAPAILALAREIAADVIALETHGRPILSRFFHGSVTDAIIHGSDVPVLVCRMHGPAHGGNGHAAARNGRNAEAH
jgi:nucleotide-binding universal stress UspA family protein